MLGAVLLFAMQATPAVASDQPATRTLVGTVLTKSDKPLANAIVYLKNTRTLTVKTYIAEKDGSYSFHSLSPNDDYEVHAEWKGSKSDTKTLSSFDSRREARINLHIKVE